MSIRWAKPKKLLWALCLSAHVAFVCPVIAQQGDDTTQESTSHLVSAKTSGTDSPVSVVMGRNAQIVGMLLLGVAWISRRWTEH